MPREAALADGFRTPILAFEFADSLDDLAFLTGQGELAVAHRAAMDMGNKVDLIFPYPGVSDVIPLETMTTMRVR